MLHGYTDSHRSFDLLRPHLPEGWRVIAVTARGHGQSDKPDSGYACADMAGDGAALLDALGVERALIVGHSMGASVALQFAADHPQRTAGLVLIGAFAGFQDKPAVLELAEAVASFEERVDPEFVLAFQESTFAEMIPQRFLDTIVAESARCPAFVWRAALQGQLKAANVDAALRCRAPALLIHGSKDAFVPLEDQLKLRDLLPSARIFSMQGVGHAPHWERPAETASLIQGFVGELADAGAPLRHAVFG
jgi:pimeloyl-ACP methyl ester carboxylesterase